MKTSRTSTKPTERDQAHKWYSDSHNACFGFRPKADISGTSTAELWNLGDEYNERANEEVLRYNKELDAGEEIEANETIFVNSPFAALSDMFVG